MAFGTAVIIFAVMWFINKKINKWQVPWWLNLALAFLGGAALAVSWAGAMATGWITSAAGAIGPLVQMPGSWIAGGIALILMLIVGADIIWDHTSNKTAIGALIAFPLFAVAAGGVVGAIGDAVRTGGSQAGPALVAALIGG